MANSCLNTKQNTNIEKGYRNKKLRNQIKCNKMRWFSKLVTLFVLFTLYITVYWSFGKSFELGKIRKYPFSKLNKTNSDLHIGVVVCGSERVEEVLVLIKSALVFSTKTYHLKFAIISEKPLFQLLTVKLEAFQTFHNFSFILKEIKFPEDQREVWKKLFKPCASQRLFLPSLLPKIDKLIYVDSDTLFLSSPSEIYEQFNKFNSSQFAGLIQEAESPNTGWYTRFARHPFPKPFGVNSGVMLMDLKKMREVMWEKTLMPIYDKYNLRIVFGDQDILNIYFHFNSDQLYILPCEFNYRPDHCMYVSLCSAPKGIQIVHGNRGYFHKADQPIFSQIYDVMQKYQLNTNPCRNIIQEIEFQVQGTNLSSCNKLSEKFLKMPKKLLKNCNDNID